MLYNWAAEHPDCLCCVAGIYPVCNLRSYPGLEKASPAYNMSVQQLEEQLADHNPIDRLAPLARANIPLMHLHGDCDAIVPLDDNSAEMKRRYDQLGGPMTLQVVSGGEHDYWTGWFRHEPLVDFICSHLQKS
jgi:pimeloyl-ACP methyl ester carboxylesterase